MTATANLIGNDNYETKFGFHDDEAAFFKANKGLSPALVNMISDMKDEPQWMREFRLRALELFNKSEDPAWGSHLLKEIDFDNIHYFVRATDRDESSWEDVPDYIRNTFDKLGIPEAEKKFLAGVGAQYDSEVVYHNIREDLAKLGVVFLGTDQALKEYPELFKEHFATIVPPGDNR
ncbi:MAG TPA: Fe-S cluster assembly protein SufB, partial [Tepidiformaceae bacterium]|nr:Fe-S cluster assembly protein SufB [Tepidiformaceae bacterium]